MDPGRLDKRAAFFRRVDLAQPRGGNLKGDYAPDPFLTVWAQFVQAQGRKVVEAGMMEDQIGASLRIRDSAAARAITNADRVRVAGVSYEIVSVGQPERRGGYIDIVIRRRAGGA